MRSKRVSWKKQVMDVTLEKGNLESVMEDFSFNRFFLSLYGNRPSCFHCHYTSYKRPGDFTLGDFWNVENAGVTFDVEGGVNLVLVNTPKGQKLFDQLKGEADYQSVSKKARLAASSGIFCETACKAGCILDMNIPKATTRK